MIRGDKTYVQIQFGHRVMFVDLLPNVVAQVIVYGSLLIPAAIVSEATLSYLGVGIQAPTADWGAMISDGAQYFYQWWIGVAPGLAILTLGMAFNFIGDGLRDHFDVRAHR